MPIDVTPLFATMLMPLTLMLPPFFFLF